MSTKEKTWFNWHCPRCEHRNRELISFQFELPKSYEAEWDCEHCGKTSMIVFDLRVWGWYSKEKKYEIKKRKKKKRESVEKEDVGTQKDRGYHNRN